MNGHTEIETRPALVPAQVSLLMIYLLVQPVVRSSARLAGLCHKPFVAGRSMLDAGYGLLWETACGFEDRYRTWPMPHVLWPEFLGKWHRVATAEVAAVYDSGVIPRAAAAQPQDLPVAYGLELLKAFLIDRVVMEGLRSELARLGSRVWVDPSAVLRPYKDACLHIDANCHPRETRVFTADVMRTLTGRDWQPSVPATG
jgi:hypothetical protein